jgi:AcrR family transcriptional regulator
MTMKGIAERAGVGRQTVYRWWSTKAEILLEACVTDAAEALATPPHPDPAADLLAYLAALSAFLSADPAGIAYRALLGEAQHDPAVRGLVRDADLLAPSAGSVLDRVRPHPAWLPDRDLATAQLVGPVLVPLLNGAEPLPAAALRRHVDCLLAGWHL